MNKQKVLYFESEQWNKIQKFKRVWGIKSDSKAIYTLIDKGIKADSKSAPTVCVKCYDLTESYSVGPEERCFRCLNK